MPDSLSALHGQLPPPLQCLRLRWTRVPGFDLDLPLVDPASLASPLPASAVAAADAQPPFWTVVWPAARILAGILASRPDLVRGRRIVDLGCGVGLTAIVAARLGAAVTAVDIDPGARAAVSIAAIRNKLDLAVANAAPAEADLVIAADLLYDPTHASLLSPWIKRGVSVLAADCRASLATGAAAGLVHAADRRSSVWPDLDRSDQFRTVHVWQSGLELSDQLRYP